MDDIQIKANQSFANQIAQSRDLATIGGRLTSDQDKFPHVWRDILNKLHLEEGMSLLDIGCGYSYVTKELTTYARKEQIKLTLIDIPEILKAVHEDFLKDDDHFTTLYPGNFPDDLPPDVFKNIRYDRILLYGVLAYTAHPLRLIESAVSLLAPGGVFLVGDIPNLSKKGRFLSSQHGKHFEADYRKVPVEELPLYANHHEFVEKKATKPLITDEFVMQVMKLYRDKGYDVYVVPQPKELPFCYTREDLLIQKYD